MGRLGRLPKNRVIKIAIPSLCCLNRRSGRTVGPAPARPDKDKLPQTTQATAQTKQNGSGRTVGPENVGPVEAKLPHTTQATAHTKQAGSERTVGPAPIGADEDKQPQT